MFVKINNIESFKDYRQRINIFKNNNVKIVLAKGNDAFSIEGFSYPCKQYVNFSGVTDINGLISWRETAVCPVTNLSTRKRLLYHIFVEYLNPDKQSSVVIAENSSLSLLISKYYKKTIATEFLGESFTSGKIYKGILHQNFTNLSFPNESIDYIIHSDVFEHIPEYLTGFKECFRVLKKGGIMLWTLPFCANNFENIIRARVDTAGRINYLMPPEYHEDPLNPDGILCFTQFGWEMFEQLRNIGFSEAFALATWSQEFVYLDDDNLCFVAIK